MPPLPLSPMTRLVLGHKPILGMHEHDGDARRWESLSAMRAQPWSAYWLEAHHCPQVASYTWMQVQPGRYNLSMRSPSAQRVAFTDEQYAAWFLFLKNYLPEPEWQVVQLEQAVMVGLCRERHPQAAQPGQLEQYPLWLRLKTELEMSLFEAVRQGEQWSGTNGLLVSGSGALPDEAARAEPWAAIPWTTWVSAELQYQAIGKSLGIEVLSSYDEAALNDRIQAASSTGEKAIWIDLSSLTASSPLEWGVKAWQKGRVEELVVSSWIQSQCYRFTLPAWPRWRRWLYGVQVRIDARRRPWTASRFMADILEYHPPESNRA